MTLPLLSKERFCHRSNWMWLHYMREGMMPLPDSGESGRLFYNLSLTEWVSPERQWAKGLLMIRLQDRVVWQLWHWTKQKHRKSIHNEDGIGEGSNMLWQSRAGSCIKLCYAGWFMQDKMTLLSTVSLQQASKWDTIQKKKTSLKVHTIHDATYCNFYLHLLQQKAPFKVLYIPICSRQQVWRGKWMQFPYTVCYCFHFRWCRRLASNLKITLYLTFQSWWRHLIWEVFFGKWWP